jgi:menaquinone-specific isochorismate synthase
MTAAPTDATLVARPTGWPDPADFRWRTLALPPGPAIDPFALCCGGAGNGPGVVLASGHLVLAGHGIAATLALPHGVAGDEEAGAVRRWLRSVPVAGPDAGPVAGPDAGPDAAGSGPLAMGALPFAPGEPGSLVVPSCLYGRSGDREWVTLVSPVEPGSAEPAAPDAAALRATLAALRPPIQSTVRRTGVTGPPEADFTGAVRRALAAIAAGRATKVVLARRVVASFDGPLDATSVLRRLHALEPAATVYGVVDDAGAFVGASPELLVTRRGTRVESWPLAGTVGLRGDDALDDDAVAHLQASPKETDEHGQVVDAIVDALAPLCVDRPSRTGPTVARLRTVAHLASRVSGTLAAPVDALALAAALHPTPAVAGSPTPVALDLLRELEPDGRARYAGPVGWMDGRGDGDFVVAIRGATLRGDQATVYAGAGIVAGSDPDQELDETSLKAETALCALGEPGAR